MPAFVLDASIAVSWCFPGDPAEGTPYLATADDLMKKAALAERIELLI